MFTVRTIQNTRAHFAEKNMVIFNDKAAGMSNYQQALMG